MFMAAWNDHPLSTEYNLSPCQLWIVGLARAADNDMIDDITDVSLVG